MAHTPRVFRSMTTCQASRRSEPHVHLAVRSTHAPRVPVDAVATRGRVATSAWGPDQNGAGIAWSNGRLGGGGTGAQLAVPELPRVTRSVRWSDHPDRRLRVPRDTDVPVHRRDGLPQWRRAGVRRAVAVDPTASRPCAAVLAGQQDRDEARDRSVPGRAAWHGRHAARGARPVAAAGARGWRCRLREAWAGAVNEARPVAARVHR